MSDHLSLRPLRVEDAVAMTDVLGDSSLYEFTGGEPPTREELERRYAVQTRGHSADHGEEWINDIVLFEQQPVGYVQATIPDDGSPAEIAWVIGRPWQGRGFAGCAVGLLVNKLAGREISHLIAHIHPDHEISQRIATRHGMAPTSTIVDGEVRWEGTNTG